MQLQLRNIWAFPFGSGFPFQSFCSFLTKRISTAIPNAKKCRIDMERRNWTREELILAYNLYCKIPYGQFNTSSIDVKELAQIIGRTPGAVAFKLVNFVSLDPRQKLLGRKGATNIGKLDKEIFEEFSTNFDEMFYESENLLSAKSLDFHKRGNVEIFVDNSKKGAYKICSFFIGNFETG